MSSFIQSCLNGFSTQNFLAASVGGLIVTVACSVVLDKVLPYNIPLQTQKNVCTSTLVTSVVSSVTACPAPITAAGLIIGGALTLCNDVAYCLKTNPYIIPQTIGVTLVECLCIALIAKYSWRDIRISQQRAPLLSKLISINTYLITLVLFSFELKRRLSYY
jgi:hypothetical protein